MIRQYRSRYLAKPGNKCGAHRPTLPPKEVQAIFRAYRVLNPLPVSQATKFLRTALRVLTPDGVTNYLLTGNELLDGRRPLNLLIDGQMDKVLKDLASLEAGVFV